MGFLNFRFGILSYDDQSASNPSLRNFDLSQDFQGLATALENAPRAVVGAGQTETVVATLRTLASDSTTQWVVERPISTDGTVRLRYTGTGAAPLFRVSRALGIDATTTVSIVRVGPNTARLTWVSGTSLTTGAIQPGDTLKFGRNTDTFTSPFGLTNVGTAYTVQAVGSGTIDFIDNGTVGLDSNIVLGAGYSLAFRVLGNGPSRIGDTVRVGGFNLSNCGEFVLTDVDTDFVEFLNPYGVPETQGPSGGTSVVVYDHLITFLHITSTGPVRIAFDGGASMELGTLGQTGPVVFMGTVRTYQINAVNTGPSDVTVTIRHMAVS